MGGGNCENIFVRGNGINILLYAYANQKSEVHIAYGILGI